jgi:lipoprotein-releasing system permease protein
MRLFAPYELALGLRYLRAKRRNHFISVIAAISVLGIAVGVTALITVLSVMNGFETELRARILAMTAHATVEARDGGLDDWAAVVESARAEPGVLGAAPYVQGEAMVGNGGKLSGVMLRGVDPALEPAVSEVGERMVFGAMTDLAAGEYGVVLGSELAYALGVGPGDRVLVLVSQGTLTPAGFVPRTRRFTVTGVFEVGMYEYDRTLAVVHIKDAAKLLGLGEGVSGVRLKLADMFAAPRTSRALEDRLGPELIASDWTRQHVNFFRAIRTEKTVMFVILALIVAVAAFNIISTLVMVVTEKEPDIAILRTLGATPRSIMAVFMVQGTLIGLLGTLLGVAGGVALALNVETIVPLLERQLGVEFLPADVYYISSLPAELHAIDVLRIGALSFALSLLSTVLPALRASRVRPAEALRYE